MVSSQRMVSILVLVLVLALALGCASSGNDRDATGGTITVSLVPAPGPTVAPMQEPEPAYLTLAVFPAGANPSNQSNLLAAGSDLIEGGVASARAMADLDTVWTGVDGSSYDVYVWQEKDDPPTLESGPDYGELVIGGQFFGPQPQSFTMNGDKLLEYQSDEFEEWSEAALLGSGAY